MLRWLHQNCNLLVVKFFLIFTNKSIKHPITSVAQLCLHSWWSHMVFIIIYLYFYSITAIRHLVPEYYQLTALVWIVNLTWRHLKWFEIWKGFEHFPGSIKCIFTIIGFQKLANVFIFFYEYLTLQMCPKVNIFWLDLHSGILQNILFQTKTIKNHIHQRL